MIGLEEGPPVQQRQGRAGRVASVAWPEVAAEAQPDGRPDLPPPPRDRGQHQEQHRCQQRGGQGLAVPPAAAAAARGAATHGQVTLLGALGRLSSLEELVLAYDEIFGTTAVLLPPALSGLARLRKLDLTRNHIPKQVMQALKEEMPARVELRGLDQQTFFFY
mmetsp:Transcript_79762/g.223239  ORF Transcript_79762/g.223239 Transcript_79762/m.223239 type:complete len:163 (+) Transcript_79762:1005-1493(+)